MAALTEDQIRNAFQPYLNEDEQLLHAAYGVKMPSLLTITLLVATVGGMLAVMFLTKNFLVGISNRRLIILQVKSPSNGKVLRTWEFEMSELVSNRNKSWSGSLFTYLKIDQGEEQFDIKFHRMFSPANRDNAIAIGESVVAPKAA